jgi:hypothetical protein
MSNSTGEPVDPGTADAVAAPPPKKSGGGPLVLLFAVVGAGIATAAVLMSRGIPAPEAAVPPAPAPKAAPAAPSVADVAAPSKWGSGARWVSNDHKSVAFELKSSNRVSVWMGQVQPSLVVRCVSNQTEVFVFTETAARIEPGMEDRAVRVRFDDEPYVEERWPDSAEHKGLFAPRGETFAQRLLDARTLRFEFTPHNAEAAEVVFNVAGLRALIEPVQKK